MTRRRWILGTTAFVLLLTSIVVWLLDKTAEPTYKGRRLSNWVSDLRPAQIWRSSPPVMTVGRPVATGRGNWSPTIPGPQAFAPITARPVFVVDRTKHDAASAAIREIGTNAIPHLLRAIYARDGKFKIMCMKWSQKQKLIKLPLQSVRDQQERSLTALSQLGAQALWTWVEIVTNDAAEPEVQVYAAQRLSNLGREAMPALPAMLLMDNHREPRVWSALGSAIERCDRDGVLLYRRYLRWDNANIRASAAWSLGFLGKYPDMVIPALIRALGDREPEVRREALLALGKFGADALPITNYIHRAMVDPEHRVRSAATNAWEQLLAGELTD